MGGLLFTIVPLGSTHYFKMKRLKKKKKTRACPKLSHPTPEVELKRIILIPQFDLRTKEEVRREGLPGLQKDVFLAALITASLVFI